jgi:hypothetical protein
LALDAGYSLYHSVPQAYLDRYSEDALTRWFRVAPIGAYDDYVYRQGDLAELMGNRYSKKRNLINQFQRDYLDKDRVTLEAMEEAHGPECLEFLEAWCAERDCSPEDNIDLACEKEAAANMLTDFRFMDVQGLVARVDSRIQAFAVGAHLTKDMGVLHFEKAIGSIKGLYQYFDRECARHLFSNFQYINKESDMGVPGLAKAKKSYHPVKQIHAYTLKLIA